VAIAESSHVICVGGGSGRGVRSEINRRLFWEIGVRDWTGVK
jgi:hypothetical protein